jgi:hypothetical protein
MLSFVTHAPLWGNTPSLMAPHTFILKTRKGYSCAITFVNHINNISRWSDIPGEKSDKMPQIYGAHLEILNREGR